MDAEVIVVGGGHNGLICAAYLARAGLDTLVLEARDDVGGCASTVTDLGARFNICNCDHVMVRGMPVADELELESHGLQYLEPTISSIFRFHDDAAPWVFLHDVDAHLDALAASYPAQVPGYRRYLSDAMPVAELVLELARTTPSAPKLLGTVARRRSVGAARLLRWSRMSTSQVLEEYFDDWHVMMPAISAGPTVWGVPPTTPGTGLAALAYATRHLVRTGRPEGGSGALTDAVRGSLEAAGGTVRCGAVVERLLLRDGVVVGVRLTDGSEVTGSTVVAACDPRSVLVDWLDTVPPAARRLVERYRQTAAPDGYESKIDAVVRGLPRYRDAPIIDAIAAGAEQLAPTTIISPSPAQLAEAHELRASGLVAPHPTLLVNLPSVLDPTMQPGPGEHVLSIEALFTPYDHPGGWPASTEPQRWLDVLDTFLEPGSLEVDRWRAMTPDRYEDEFRMHRGHTPAYSGAPLRALLGRDRETTRYRTPIGGLYLTGAGTFPGAGIFGAAGRNAADAVVRDLSGSRFAATAVRRRIASATRTR